jgi:ABC-type phosphate transport system substrate-binding protein
MLNNEMTESIDCAASDREADDATSAKQEKTLQAFRIAYF